MGEKTGRFSSGESIGCYRQRRGRRLFSGVRSNGRRYGRFCFSLFGGLRFCGKYSPEFCRLSRPRFLCIDLLSTEPLMVVFTKSLPRFLKSRIFWADGLERPRADKWVDGPNRVLSCRHALQKAWPDGSCRVPASASECLRVTYRRTGPKQRYLAGENLLLTKLVANEYHLCG